MLNCVGKHLQTMSTVLLNPRTLSAHARLTLILSQYIYVCIVHCHSNVAAIICLLYVACV